MMRRPASYALIVLLARRLCIARLAAIIGLLAGETPRSRQIAYDAFAALDPTDKELFLTYLKASRIEDAHPAL